MIQVVLVLVEAYPLAVSLSEKISLSKGLRWSAMANGKLCCTTKLATFTSARVTYGSAYHHHPIRIK